MRFTLSLVAAVLTLKAQIPGVQGLLFLPSIDINVAALTGWLQDEGAQGQQQDRLIDPHGIYKDLPELVEDIDDSEDDDDELWAHDNDKPEHTAEELPTLLDTQLAVSRDVSIFAGYVRDLPDLNKRFTDANKFSVIFAPSNSAITKLAAKPWEFPTKVQGSEEERDAITQDNLKDFVEKHIFFGELTRMLEFSSMGFAELETEGGLKLEIHDSPTGARVKTEDSKVYNVLTQKNVYNGMIWVLDGSLSGPQ